MGNTKTKPNEISLEFRNTNLSRKPVNEYKAYYIGENNAYITFDQKCKYSIIYDENRSYKNCDLKDKKIGEYIGTVHKYQVNEYNSIINAFKIGIINNNNYAFIKVEEKDKSTYIYVIENYVIENIKSPSVDTLDSKQMTDILRKLIELNKNNLYYHNYGNKLDFIFKDYTLSMFNIHKFNDPPMDKYDTYKYEDRVNKYRKSKIDDQYKNIIELFQSYDYNQDNIIEAFTNVGLDIYLRKNYITSKSKKYIDDEEENLEDDREENLEEDEEREEDEEY